MNTLTRNEMQDKDTKPNQQLLVRLGLLGLRDLSPESVEAYYQKRLNEFILGPFRPFDAKKNKNKVLKNKLVLNSGTPRESTGIMLTEEDFVRNQLKQWGQVDELSVKPILYKRIFVWIDILKKKRQLIDFLNEKVSKKQLKKTRNKKSQKPLETWMHEEKLIMLSLLKKEFKKLSVGDYGILIAALEKMMYFETSPSLGFEGFFRSFQFVFVNVGGSRGLRKAYYAAKNNIDLDFLTDFRKFEEIINRLEISADFVHNSN